MSEQKTGEAEFTVLMIGQRRAGKSSVLAAMLKSMEKLENMTGFQFLADSDTQLLMDKKAAHLEKIFFAHADDNEFTTLEGTKNNIDYSLHSDVSVTYRFSLGLKESEKKRYSVEFVDIRGEDMLSDLESGDDAVVERIGKASVIMIAVDSPAVMEGRWKKEYGEFHERVNIPDNIYQSIVKADARMREKLEEGQKLPPKMVLFVPLKCEKYYHEGSMDKLKEAVKKGYENLFTFLAGCEEYSVAITPILTLGDVVFSRYETRQLASGKEVVDTFKDGVPESMISTPRAPLFKFREVAKPQFSPKYCEQPLMYLLAHVLGMAGAIEKLEEEEKKQKQKKGFWGKVINAVKHAFLYWLFGLFYVAFLGVRALMQDKPFLNQVKEAVKCVKFEGDGYELVQDRIGLKAVVNK